MVRKTDNERLKELDEQLEKIKVRKQQLESRVREKERKVRTKRLIEVGAVFEKYFEILGKEEAEKIAIAFRKQVLVNKEKVLSVSKEDVERVKSRLEEEMETKIVTD